MYSDALYHYGVERKNHKYIRKVRTASGNWRYIYDEIVGNNAKKDLDKATRDASRSDKIVSEANRMNEARKNWNAHGWTEFVNQAQRDKQTAATVRNAKNIQSEAYDKKREAQRAYNKTPRAKIESGRKKIEKALSSVKDFVIGTPGKVKTYNRNTGEYRYAEERKKNYVR